MLLKNKVAAISGAAGLRGIGFATAKLFAEQGARVAILDIDAAAAETVASSLGGGHLGLRCDVSKKAECESAIKEVIAKTGQLDILINNAGITQALNVWDIDDDSWNRMLDVNLRGVLYLSQAAIPHMREKKAGSIVCTASGFSAIVSMWESYHDHRPHRPPVLPQPSPRRRQPRADAA